MPEALHGIPSVSGYRLDRVVYPETEIRARVEQMGREITAYYEGRRGTDEAHLLVLGLLKGSFIFLADLVRSVRLPLHVDFLGASSYGSGTVSSGEVTFVYDSSVSVAGRDVLVIEDIVDSGTTLAHVLPRLRGLGAASVEVCTLLHKRLVELDEPARWVGFDAPGDFLVGYGLDYSEHFRHLPFIAALRQGETPAAEP